MTLEDIDENDPRPVIEFYDEQSKRKIFAVNLAQADVERNNPDHVVIKIKQ